MKKSELLERIEKLELMVTRHGQTIENLKLQISHILGLERISVDYNGYPLYRTNQAK